MSIFGERLKQLRLKRGLTQDEFANKFLRSKSIISNYENGSRSPDIESLCDFADFFDVSTDYMLGRIENKTLSIEYLWDTVGLNEDSVKKLSALHEYSYVLNYLICHFKFEKLLSEFQGYAIQNDESTILEQEGIRATIDKISNKKDKDMLTQLLNLYDRGESNKRNVTHIITDMLADFQLWCSAEFSSNEFPDLDDVYDNITGDESAEDK
jgi:transcriptional regulator with XRE-family HTH domain